MGCICSKTIHNDVIGSLHDDESDEQSLDLFDEFQGISFYNFLNSENPIIKNYYFDRELSSGKLSSVYLAHNVENDEDKYAAKVYSYNIIGRASLSFEEPFYVSVQREVDILNQISHRYVACMLDIFNDEDTNSLIIMFPYADHGTAKSRFEESDYNYIEVKTCFHQIAVGLAYIHSLNIVHRDIKPENFLCYNEKLFSISDFSESRQLSSDDELMIDVRGSPAFLSPEECSGEEYHPKPADVWSYGVSLYTCTYRDFPFNISSSNGMSLGQTILNVANLLQEYELTFPDDAYEKDPILVDLLKKILVKEPCERLSFEDISKHEWFNDVLYIDQENIKAEASYEIEARVE